LALALAIVVALETVLGKRSIVWVVLRIVGLLFVAGGVAHFAYPAGYRRIVPSWEAWGWWYIPGSPNFHVVWSGIAEILGGLGVLLGGVPYLPRWVGPWSANALFALTVCVTPANVSYVGLPAITSDRILTFSATLSWNPNLPTALLSDSQ